MADQAGALAYAHGSAFTTEPLERYAADVGVHLPIDGPVIYPVQRRFRGHRDRPQTGPRLSPRPRRAGPMDRLRALGELPRQHARRPGPVRTQAAAPALRGVAGPLPARVRGLSVPGGRSRRQRPGHRRRTGRGTGGGDRRGRGRGPSLRSWPSRSSGPRWGAVTARRLLAEDRRGLPPPRRAAHRRRGHDRVRADRALVRARPLGVRPDLLVAAKGATSGYWPFGFVAASDEVPDRPRRRASSTASRTRTDRWRRPSPTRSCASWRRRTWSRRRDEGRAAQVAAARAPGRPSGRRRDPRPGADGRRGTGPRPRDQGAVPARGEADRGRRADARDRGVLVYSGTGNADGTNGDTILLGPPFVITDDELARIADGLGDALDAALAELAPPGADAPGSAPRADPRDRTGREPPPARSAAGPGATARRGGRPRPEPTPRPGERPPRHPPRRRGPPGPGDPARTAP